MSERAKSSDPSRPFLDTWPYAKPRDEFRDRESENWRLTSFALGSALVFAIYTQGFLSQRLTLNLNLADLVLTGCALFVTTVLVSRKQDRYYSGDERPGSKDGIFANFLYQVNSQENDIDTTLAILGGLLFPFAFVPPLWFLIFGSSSLFTLLRCFVTLRRPVVANKYKAELQDSRLHECWISNIISGSYAGNRVKEILSGWIVSHTLWTAFGLTAFSLLFLYPLSPLEGLVLVVFVIVALFGIIQPYLSRWSLKAGGRLCHYGFWTRAFGLYDQTPSGSINPNKL